MYKLILACFVFVSACGSDYDNKKTYIVSGQSNANGCDWSLYKEATGNEIINIAVDGASIDVLLEKYNDVGYVDGVFFIHGESDGFIQTPMDIYVANIEEYLNRIGGDVFISTVGYFRGQPDINFEAVRYATKYAALKNGWTIAFDEAHTFRDRGMLYDGIHFKKEACRELIDGFISKT